MPKNSQLKAEVIDGEMVITIGVDILSFAMQSQNYWPEGAEIKSNELFAEDICKHILMEEEDGSTPIHRMLDTIVNSFTEDCDCNSVSYND